MFCAISVAQYKLIGVQQQMENMLFNRVAPNAKLLFQRVLKNKVNLFFKCRLVYKIVIPYPEELQQKNASNREYAKCQ